MESSIYFIIVTYNGKKWMQRSLNSIIHADISSRIIIVDNGSTDGTQEYINSNFPDTDLIQCDENLGFGKANNIGIAIALNKGAEYIFLLNQDAYLFKGSLKSSLNILTENKNIGIVSPIHFAGDGKNLDFGFHNYIKPTKTPLLAGDFFNKTISRRYYETDFVNAAAWIVRASVFNDLGSFNPIFTHYGEDDEFINRLKKNNLMVCIDPHLSIIHDRPQNRNNNNFFHRLQSLERHLLISYFKGVKITNASIFKSYFKLFLIYLFNFNFRKAWLTIIYFFKSINSRKRIKQTFK